MSTEPPNRRKRTNVGVPVREREITLAVERHAKKFLNPGPGRSLYVMTEPEVGQGIPDVILIAVSSRVVEKISQSGPRLRTLTAARALSLGEDASTLGVSRSHGLALRRDLTTAGWGDSDLPGRDNVIPDSVVIEAKVAEWTAALRQIAKYRWAGHRAFLAMPAEFTHRVSRRSLEFYDTGLAAVGDDRINILEGSARRKMSTAHQLWTLELLVRGLESGTAYRFSARTKPSRASL